MSNYSQPKTSVPVEAIPVTGTIIANENVRAFTPQPNYTTPFGTRQISDDQVECYSLRKTVMLLCGIDIFFGLLYAFYNPYFIIPTLLASVGFYGARNYNSSIVFCYFIYITLDWLAKLSIYIANVVNHDPNTVSPGSTALLWVFIIVSTLIDIWISKIVYKYWRSLKEISIFELADLKERQIRKYHYIYW